MKFCVVIGYPRGQDGANLSVYTCFEREGAGGSFSHVNILVCLTRRDKSKQSINETGRAGNFWHGPLGTKLSF